MDIASFYWTLSNQDTHTHDPSAGQVRGGAQEPQTHLQGGGGVKLKGRQRTVHRQRWVLSLIQSS